MIKILILYFLGVSSALAFSNQPYVMNPDFDSQLVKIFIRQNVPDARGNLVLSESVCSGTLISPTAVMTAAHCFYQVNIVSVSVENSVGVGQVALVDSIRLGQGFHGYHTQVMPKRSSLFLSYPVADYSVFELAAPFPMFWPKDAIRLAQNDAEAKKLLRSGQCYSAGFGPVTLPQPVVKVRENFIEHVFKLNFSNEQFQNHHVELPDQVITHLPAQITQGDSGGPVACYNNAGKLILVGINSGYWSVPVEAYSSTLINTDFMVRVSQDCALD